MKKNSLNFIATIVLAVMFSIFLPWWSVMIAAFIAVLLFTPKGFSIFLMPFLAIFIFWTLYAFMLSSANNFILTNKIAILLPLGGNPYILIGVTALIGGIAGGVSGLFGKETKELIKNR